jgi:hypothetical protein
MVVGSDECDDSEAVDDSTVTGCDSEAGIVALNRVEDGNESTSFTPVLFTK